MARIDYDNDGPTAANGINQNQKFSQHYGKQQIPFGVARAYESANQ